jgi:hypothetical protein
MYTIPAQNPTAFPAITSTNYDIKNSLFGNSAYTATQHRDVDDRAGWRPGQPSFVKTIRVPQYHLDFVATHSPASSLKETVDFDRPMTNVTLD